MDGEGQKGEVMQEREEKGKERIKKNKINTQQLKKPH